MKEPHSLLFREDLNRLYVVDGTLTIGAVRIFVGKDFSMIKSRSCAGLMPAGAKAVIADSGSSV